MALMTISRPGRATAWIFLDAKSSFASRKAFRKIRRKVNQAEDDYDDNDFASAATKLAAAEALVLAAVINSSGEINHVGRLSTWLQTMQFDINEKIIPTVALFPDFDDDDDD